MMQKLRKIHYCNLKIFERFVYYFCCRTQPDGLLYNAERDLLVTANILVIPYRNCRKFNVLSKNTHMFVY